MKKRSEKKSISGIAALLLLVVFALGILSILLSGAGVYQRLTDQNADSYDRHTCIQYLANKVRQIPASGTVVISDFGDGDSFTISEWIDGEEYWTQIYCHNGWLMELFTVANAGFEPEDGESILPAKNLTVTVDGSLLRIGIADSEGNENTLLWTVRGGRQGGYEE